MQNIIALIPARKDSQRFYAKLLYNLGNKPVVWHTVYNAKKTKLFSKIILATDSDEIVEAVQDLSVEIFRSKLIHQSGSDRISEAAKDIYDADLFINIQADEPFLNKGDLARLIDIFNTDSQISVASLMCQINDSEADNSDRVKVVVDRSDFALYFSRAKIPFCRERNAYNNYWQHIGIYAFKPESLRAFSQLEISNLEFTEKLECLRFLEHGLKVKMLHTTHKNLSIDSPDDLILAQSLLKDYQNTDLDL